MKSGEFPFWKLKREALRLWMQLGIPFELLTMPLRRRLHDANKRKTMKISQGAQPLRKNVAIVLVYQPDRLPNSLYETLKHLNENGFSPLVVSNTVLSGDDRKNLNKYAYQVLERPNSGYDFGGYRDGVLHLLDAGIAPDNLILINDSVWFPVRRNCDFLEQLESESADLYGVIYSERPGAPSRAHLQSYFFNFKKRVVQDPSFREFWEKLFFTNNKFLVIRRCEMKLTQFFESRGFTIGWFSDQKDLDKAVLSLSKPELEAVARYQIKVDYKHSRLLEEFLGSGFHEKGWHDEVEVLVKNRALGKYILIAHPILLFTRLNLPILKRDKQAIYQVQRSELLNSGLDEIVNPSVTSEIRKNHMFSTE